MAVSRDMEELGVRPQLWVQQMVNGSYTKPTIAYVMTNQENKNFMHIIKKLKTPTNYAKSL